VGRIRQATTPASGKELASLFYRASLPVKPAMLEEIHV